jgi:hypothetical protein
VNSLRQGLKPKLLGDYAARLKPCPDTKRSFAGLLDDKMKYRAGKAKAVTVQSRMSTKPDRFEFY